MGVYKALKAACYHVFRAAISEVHTVSFKTLNNIFAFFVCHWCAFVTVQTQCHLLKQISVKNQESAFFTPNSKNIFEKRLDKPPEMCGFFDFIKKAN